MKLAVGFAIGVCALIGCRRTVPLNSDDDASLREQTAPIGAPFDSQALAAEQHLERERDARTRAAYLALPPTTKPTGSASWVEGAPVHCPENYSAARDDAGAYCGKLCDIYSECGNGNGTVESACCNDHACNQPSLSGVVFQRRDGPAPKVCSRSAIGTAHAPPSRR